MRHGAELILCSPGLGFGVQGRGLSDSGFEAIVQRAGFRISG